MQDEDRWDATNLGRRSVDASTHTDVTVLTRAPKKGDSAWKTLAHSLNGEEYASRTKKYYELMVRVNGMLSGFSFIAMEEEPTLTGAAREIYGIVGVAGFCSACIATIISLILFAALTLLGPECATYFGGNK